MSNSSNLCPQTCRWQFLAFSGTFTIALSVSEVDEARELTFRLEQSSFMRGFQGAWRVADRPDGGCTVHHVLSVKPLVDVPAPVAAYMRSIFVKQARGCVVAAWSGLCCSAGLGK